MKIYHCDENGSILWNEDPPMSKAYSLDENSSQKWISSNVKKNYLSYEHLSLLWKFITVVKMEQCHLNISKIESLSLWWQLFSVMIIYHCDWNSLNWWKLRTLMKVINVIEIYRHDVNSSPRWKWTDFMRNHWFDKKDLMNWYSPILQRSTLW